jgi:hypothetical protein
VDLPDNIASAPGYAPKLPSQGDGWEEWVMVVEGTVNGREPPLLRPLGRGDPSDPDSKLETDCLSSGRDSTMGRLWAYAFPGPSLQRRRCVKTWAIGDNKLMFDGATGSWSLLFGTGPRVLLQISRRNVRIFPRFHHRLSCLLTHVHTTSVPNQGRHSPRS